MPVGRAVKPVHLVPVDGGRHSHSRTSPCGPGRYSCRAKAVAQIINEDFPYPISRAALCDKTRRKSPGKVLDDGLGESLDGIPIMPPLQRRDDMQAFASAR